MLGESIESVIEPVVVNRKPKSLLKLCFGTYIWTMDSGNLQIKVPEVVTPAELLEVEELFGIVLRRLKRNVAE